MKPVILVALLIGVFVRCVNNFTPQNSPETMDNLTIRTGTAFGMCVGYCQNDYVFNGTSVMLTQGNVRPQAQVATRSCQSTITQTQWDAIKVMANLDAFSKVANVLGCPDCTDGGAEYLEIQVNDQKHRVTFPFGKIIPGFEALVDSLRIQRNAFKNCP